MARADGGPGLVLGPGDPGFGATGRTTPFLLPDQDALNLAVMAYAEQVSLMGPQAMALGPGCRWALVGLHLGRAAAALLPRP